VAKHYYNATGVLVLERVTPVIDALFGAFGLDREDPGNGRASIASGLVLWSDVRERLVDLAKTFGLSLKENPSFQELLETLAVHYGARENGKLAYLLESKDFETLDDEADLETLFAIASCLDDGHRLAAISWEGCWSCSKPRLYEFGGEGYFISREVRLYEASHDTLFLASSLQKTIAAKDAEATAALVAQKTFLLLSGIGDATFAEQLRAKVARRLLDRKLGLDGRPI
jgi:hypothetical protein